MESLSLNRRNAVIVRLGEKRILSKVLASLQQTLSELSEANVSIGNAGNGTERSNKRARGDEVVGVAKKLRR